MIHVGFSLDDVSIAVWMVFLLCHPIKTHFTATQRKIKVSYQICKEAGWIYSNKTTEQIKYPVS